MREKDLEHQLPSWRFGGFAECAEHVDGFDKTLAGKSGPLKSARGHDTHTLCTPIIRNK